MGNMPLAINDYSDNLQKPANADMSELHDYNTFVGKMKDNGKKPEVQKSPRRSKATTPMNQRRVVEKDTAEKNRREGAAGVDDSTRNLRKNGGRSNNDRSKR